MWPPQLAKRYLSIQAQINECNKIHPQRAGETVTFTVSLKPHSKEFLFQRLCFRELTMKHSHRISPKNNPTLKCVNHDRGHQADRDHDPDGAYDSLRAVA